MNPEGYFNGKIAGASLEEDNDGGLVVVFDVDITDDGTDGSCQCRHRTTGDYAHVTREVVEHLELEWPYGLERLSTTVGRSVRVRVKHKPGKKAGEVFENCYIVTKSRGKPATNIGTKIADLARSAGVPVQEGPDGDIPF